MIYWTALKSAWRAGLKQYRKRLTELRRGPVPKNVTVGAPTSGVPLIISSGRVYGPDEWPIKDQPASLTVPIKGPQDHAS